MIMKILGTGGSKVVRIVFNLGFIGCRNLTLFQVIDCVCAADMVWGWGNTVYGI